jgi:spermidine synthase
VFAALSRASAKPHVAVVGLGAGSLAAYAAPGQPFTYYEIDPAVNRLAHDSRYFTFLRDSPAQVEVILGDARLSLAEAPPRQYGLLVVDAFSSDAIPLHLLTREALELYLNKLAEDGLLAFNISNRYVQLEPVLGDLARSLGLVCLGQADLNLTEAEKQAGKSPSQWVILARTRADLGKLVNDPRWQAVPGRSNVPAWTDDFSNLFSVFQWN